MKIPYGRSNFGEIRRRGFFYVDKTPFLPVLERDESGYAYLLFHRPRRMGKSLFVSLLEHYYDLARAEEFDALFRGLWIHEHPTPERNRYLVLSLDFSTVTADGGQDSLRRSFLEGLKARVRTFLMRYRERIPALGDFHDNLSEYHEASDLMVNLLGIIAATGYQLYVLIDEYDHFSNSLLSAGSEDLYASLVERTGFVRAFYATLKAGTTSGAVGACCGSACSRAPRRSSAARCWKRSSRRAASAAASRNGSARSRATSSRSSRCSTSGW